MGIRLGRFVPRTRRTRLYVGGTIVVLVLIGAIAFPAVVRSIVRSKLQSLVNDQLNAELVIGSFDYDFPYGVTLLDTKLVARDRAAAGEPVSLLELKRLDLTLARSPLGGGPLLIKELVIDQPSVRIIRTANGVVGQRTLVKPQNSQERRRRLSETFELRRVAVTGGQVVYEDRTKPGVVPLVWRGLQLDLGTRPQAPAVYAYEVKAGAPPMATLDARGEINIDDLIVRVAGATLDATLRPDSPEIALPGELRASLRQFAVDGRLRLTASGVARLRDIQNSTFNGTLDLADARGRLPAYGLDVRRLAMTVAYAKPDIASPLRVELKNLRAETSEGVVQAGGGTVELAGDQFDVRHAAGSITLSKSARFADLDPRGTVRFAGSVRGKMNAAGPRSYAVSLDATGVSLRLPNVPQRVESINGGLKVADGQVTLGTVRAAYGRRAAVTIRGGRGAFGRDGSDWTVEGVTGSIAFREAPSATAVSNDSLDALAPIGDIDFTLSARSPSDFTATLTPRDVSLALPGFGDRLEKVQGTIRVNRDAASIENLNASLGADQFTVAAATVPFKQTGGRIRIKDVAASINFGSPAPAYPPALAQVLTAIGPIGTYNVTGSLDLDRSTPSAKPAFNLRVTTEVGAVSPSVVRTPVLFPKATIAVTRDAANISGLEVPVFGGKLVGGLRVQFADERISYEGSFDFRNVELADAKMLWLDPGEGEQDIRGKANGFVKVWGEIPKGKESSFMDGLRADGTLRVADGYFYDVPVLHEICDWLGIDGGSVVGEAAVGFTVQDRKLNIKRGVVSAPVLALQAKGDIGFDGRLKLVVTAAAPREQPTVTRNRGRSGVDRFVGGLVGAVNQGLSRGAQWGLYEFHVTGNNDTPRLRVVTPAINQTIDNVVGSIREFARDANRR